MAPRRPRGEDRRHLRRTSTRRRLGAAASHPSAERAYDPKVLYGRDTERARIDALLDAARASRSHALIIRGELGVGKSALLGYAAERADPLAVLRATGRESEFGLAFAGLYQLLSPVLDRIERLPPPQAQALLGAFGLAKSEVHDRFLIAVAVLNALGEAATGSGLLCAVDDAHWLDEPSIEALLFVARRLEAEGIAMLVALRDDDRLAHATEGIPVLTLGALSADAAEMLLQRRTDHAPSPAVREQLVAWSGGNPLALTSLADALSVDQRSGRAPLDEPLPIGEEVQRVFLGRVAQLPDDAHALLLLAAADDRGDVDTLQWAAEALDIDFAALEDLLRSQFLCLIDARVDFPHPLLRTAVYLAASRNERRDAHRALAAALKDEADADRRWWHRAAAAVGSDEEIATELERSAVRARLRGGHAAAAATLERAASLSVGSEFRVRRLVAAAEAHWLAGHTPRVGPLLDRAQPLPADAGLRSTVALLRGSFDVENDMLEEGYRVFVAGALESAGRNTSAALELLVCANDAAWSSGRSDWTAEIARIVQAIVPGGHSEEAFIAAVLIGSALVLDGDYEGSVEVQRPSIETADSLGYPRYALKAGQTLYWLGDPVHAHERVSRAALELRATGTLGELAVVLATLAGLEAALGWFAAGAATASEGLRLAIDIGQPKTASRCRAMLALIEASQGNERECREHARIAAETAMRSHNAVTGVYTEWALGRLDLSAGRPADAMRHLMQHADPSSPFHHRAYTLAVGPDLVEAAIRCGRADEARTVLTSLERWADATNSSWARSIVARLHGLASDGERASRHFTDALEHGRAHGIRFDQARAHLLYGQHLRRVRQGGTAARHLQEALTIFENVGAKPWAEVARAELRTLGQPIRPARADALESLTPEERQIAQFLSQGATNREVAAKLFLSPRTVEYHVHKIFVKLGIVSHVGLAKLMAQELGAIDETAGLT